MNELTEQEFEILKIIDSNDQPVGSGAISTWINKEGRKKISEATVGRILRRLDNKGYTKKIGFQGRVVTEAGLNILSIYRQEKQRERQMERLLKLSEVKDKKELIDMLIARRAIEVELAGLAAEKQKTKSLEKLKQVIRDHTSKYQSGLSGAKEDQSFHRIIATMADNSILETALKLIKSEGDLSPVLEFIREEVGSNLIKDHLKIVRAIERKAPAAARDAMQNHINNLIADVNKYWEEVEEGS